MAQDHDVKARMVKALQLAQECLREVNLLAGIGTSPSQGHPNALPVAILAVELYRHMPTMTPGHGSGTAPGI
jgi:hypothetical protein